MQQWVAVLQVQIHAFIYIYIYHHTVQVARVQVQHLRQWMDEKAPQRKLQREMPPRVQVEFLHQMKEGKHHKHKIQRSKAGPTIHPTNLALTQVAVIAALCCAGHICMVGGGGGCCMLLLHPVPTSADAGCDLCTLCPDLCTLHPDLWILCLIYIESDLVRWLCNVDVTTIL